MTGDVEQAQQAIARAIALREQGKNEAVLRGEFQSRLRKIFPADEDESWIDHYGEGAEAHAVIGTTAGGAANRFVDNLVGSTTIEYEPDLRIPAKFEDGYRQVREYTAALVKKGVPVSQVRGVLSDTVVWRAYDVSIDPLLDPSTCTPDDVVLTEIAVLDTSDSSAGSAERLILFVRAHLARERSRPLYSDNLALDLGLVSQAYQRNASAITALVANGRENDSSIELASSLWSRFVDHLEGAVDEFRISPYVDELYLNILARLLSANALAQIALSSSDQELRSIIDGSYFRHEYQLENLVEVDYFGWIANAVHINDFLPIARAIQLDLYAYDFSWRPEEDLFGRLMAQLARRSQRKLLGQEWTPAWLARHLANQTLSNIPEGEQPQLMDMCCGSGAILAEIIKSARDAFELKDIDQLRNVATGFDIDPLAVALAKTTWVLSLIDEIKNAADPVTIPIYHADSLFAVTPVSASIPMLDEADTIDVTLDGQTVKLPSALVQPDYRELFDRLVDWAYDEARDIDGPSPTAENSEQVLASALANLQLTLPAALKDAIAAAILLLALRMKELAAAGRNGIWAFILRNTYRPGLLAGQFNGLVSNPPWLAMSALADNPYRDVLKQRADLYGVTPAGQSFLHLELGTTHLLHAVDRYLRPNAAIACLVPGTILNGTHHEKFRQRAYLHSRRQVPLKVDAVWHVESGTFKYPSVALIGTKAAILADADEAVASGGIVSPDGVEAIDFSERRLGDNRTAWALERAGKPASAQSGAEISKQGADIMPRRAVCIEILNASGAEHRVDTPSQDSPWHFAVRQAKELKYETFPGRVAPQFIYQMGQSENLLPFSLGEHRAPVALPALRGARGQWHFCTPTEIRRQGFKESARRFKQVNDKLTGEPLESRIDYRSKLSNQTFDEDSYLVVSGAGGTYICAACIPASEAERLVIDQTLYWQEVENEADAWFRTGFLNSDALTQAILPFNPEGDFGPRHIHTLPYQLMPTFDPLREDHKAVSELSNRIADAVADIIAGSDYLNDPLRRLSNRRSKLRAELAESQDMKDLNSLCAKILGVETADN